MKFSIEDSDLKSQYKDEGRLAPDQLIASMLAFNPDHVITTSTRIKHDEHDWSLIGLSQAGLCLVAATAKANPNQTDMPLLTDVNAEWIPLETITRVYLRDVRESREYYKRTTEVAIDAVWVLDLKGRDPVSLPSDPADGEGPVSQFVQLLLARRQQVVSGP